MTDATDTGPLDTDEMLAAEYALGLLTGDALSDAAGRVANDPGFAGLVAQWQGRLAQMADLEPVAPPARVKRAIEGRLFGDAPLPFWRRLGLWQAVSAGAVAVALAVIVWQPQAGGQIGPLYTAEIASDAGDFRVVAVVDKTRNEVFLTRTAGAAPEGRILQVWAHGPDAPAQSVGLWPEGESLRLPLPVEIAAVQGTLTLGISEEPVGGSPTGSPSGRVFGTVDIPDVTDPV